MRQWSPDKQASKIKGSEGKTSILVTQEAMSALCALPNWVKPSKIIALIMNSVYEHVQAVLVQGTPSKLTEDRSAKIVYYCTRIQRVDIELQESKQ